MLDVITCSVLDLAGEKCQQWQRAITILAEMRHCGLQSDVITFNALISACEKDQQWQRAIGFLEEMRHSGLQSDVIPSTH